MNAISYQWKLNNLHRSRTKTVDTYRHLQGNARKEKKSRDDIEGLIHEEMFEVNMIDDAIQELESCYLIESARQLILPVPEFKKDSDTWEESNLTGQFSLSKKAMMELRTIVRKEQKGRREGMMLWLTALTGIIGALSGLIAVWKS